MQKYVKIAMMKSLLVSLLERGEIAEDEFPTITGIPKDIVEYMLSMLQSQYQEYEKNGIMHYAPVESTATMLTMPDELYERLPGFDDRNIFEKEIDIIQNGNPLYYITRTINSIHKGDRELIALSVLIGMTPWTKSDTLHIYPVGKSGKGKTSLCCSSLLAFPTNCFEPVTSSSPMSIFYAYSAGKLMNNKIIFFDDIKMNQEFIDIIKAFSGSSKVKPRHWTVDINRRFVDMAPTASYSVWLTSVTPLKDEQLKNRFIIANIDETIQQDKRVWEHIDKTYRSSSEQTLINSEEFETCRNLINILIKDASSVVVPFGIDFPVLADRRAYIYFLVLIKSIAFINKFKRKKVNGSIVATYEDFEVANRIYDKIKDTQTFKIDKDALEILDVMPDDVEDAINSTQIRTLTGKSSDKIRKKCYELLEAGLISNDKIDRWVYWKNEIAKNFTLDIKKKDNVKENLILLNLDPALEEYVKNSNPSNELIKHFDEGKMEDTKQSTIRIFDEQKTLEKTAEQKAVVSYDDVYE